MKDYINSHERLNFEFNGIQNIHEQKFNIKSDILCQVRDFVRCNVDDDKDIELFYYHVAHELADKLAELFVINAHANAWPR